MSEIRERRLELAGLRTRALELAPSAGEPGEPLLLLHGFGDSADTWRPLLARLAADGRAATAVDLPGFGEADRLDREQPILPQLDRFAAAAVRYAARRGRDTREGSPGDGSSPASGDGRAASTSGNAIVCGNSLGGVVAIRAAERARLPVSGVVAVAPAGLEMAMWMSIIEGARLLRPVLRAPLPVPDPVVRELVGRVYRMLAFARPGDVDPAQIASFTRHLGSRRDVIRMLATGRRLRGELRDPFRLERLRRPLLLVWGDRDRMVFASGAERVVAAVPEARLELIEGCGHCPQLEAPDRLAELLAAFPSVGVTA